LNPLCARLEEVYLQIAAAERLAGRAPGTVQILAVSKDQPAETVKQASLCGQSEFGESYVQEATVKIAALKDQPIDWHFIGRIQGNKAVTVAREFAWAHAIDRFRVARRLHEKRPASLPPLNICLQVNFTGEASKAGVGPKEVLPLAEQVMSLSNLRLRGLMTIGAPDLDREAQLRAFQKVKAAYDELNQRGFMCDTLSMGMSSDFHAAIAAGATLVRLGQVIFGVRS